jgi:hypothetical protein
LCNASRFVHGRAGHFIAISLRSSPAVPAVYGQRLFCSYSEMRRLKRFDEACAAAQEAADLASEYWSGSSTDQGMALREAKILGYIAKMAGLRVLLGAHGSSSAVREMEIAERVFLRHTTGGEFGVHNRTPEPQRVLQCQRAAADFTVTVRRARLSDLRGLRRRR